MLALRVKSLALLEPVVVTIGQHEQVLQAAGLGQVRIVRGRPIASTSGVWK